MMITIHINHFDGITDFMPAQCFRLATKDDFNGFTFKAGYRCFRSEQGNGYIQRSGFKPDRHIKRLFSLWFPDVIEASTTRAQELAKMIHSSSKGIREFFTFSIVGMAVTPTGHSFSEVDNLVWALGAYVEKKGKESTTRYRLD